MRYDKLLDSFKKRKYGMMAALGTASVALCIGGFGLGYQFSGLARTEIEHRALKGKVSTSIPALKDLNIKEMDVSPLLKSSYCPGDEKKAAANEIKGDEAETEILKAVHEAIRETEESSRKGQGQSGEETDQPSVQDTADDKTREDEKTTRRQVSGTTEEGTSGSSPEGSVETEQRDDPSISITEDDGASGTLAMTGENRDTGEDKEVKIPGSAVNDDETSYLDDKELAEFSGNEYEQEKGDVSETNSLVLQNIDEELSPSAIHGRSAISIQREEILKETRGEMEAELKKASQSAEELLEKADAIKEVYAFIEENKTENTDAANYLVGTISNAATKEKELKIEGLDQKLKDLSRLIPLPRLNEFISNYTVERAGDMEPAGGGKEVYNIHNDLQAALEGYEAEIGEKTEECRDYESQILENESAIEMQKIEKVFDPENVTIHSNLTVEEAKAILGDTALGYLAETFVQCEQEYDVNAVFLMSIAAHESAWGTSRRAVNDHNYTGFGVYSKSAQGINAERGQDNIRMTARHLAENYLRPGGKYYHGLSVRDVHKMYCATGGWTDGIKKHAGTLMGKLLADEASVEDPSGE